MTSISEKIAELRISKQIKQSAIARALGTDQPNYSRMEKRGEKLTIEQLSAIAEILGEDISYFFLDTKISKYKQPKSTQIDFEKFQKEEIENLRIDNRILLRQLAINDSFFSKK